MCSSIDFLYSCLLDQQQDHLKRRIAISLSKRSGRPSALLEIPRFKSQSISYSTETIYKRASIYLAVFSTSCLHLINFMSSPLSNSQAISFRIERASTPHQTGVSASVCA